MATAIRALVSDLLWFCWQFRRTGAVVLFAAAGLWFVRGRLLRWLVDTSFGEVPMYYAEPSAVLLAELRAMSIALIVIATPVLAAESWSLMSRFARSPRALRLTVPFAVTSGVLVGSIALVCVYFLGSVVFYALLGFAGS